VDAAMSVVIGALVVGVARPNNTWDYPTYLVLALLALFISGLQSRHTASQHGDADLAHVIVSGALGLGLFGAAWVLGSINDLPTFMAMAVLVFVVSQLAHRLLGPETLAAVTWRWIDIAYIAVMGLSILYFRPYTEHYATAYSSVELWKGPLTPLTPYLLIHGIFLFAIASYLIAQLHRMGKRWFGVAARMSGMGWAWVLVGAMTAATATAMLAILGYVVVLVIVPLTVMAVVLLARPRLDPARRFLLLGVLLALALTFAVEVIVLKGDIGRMNTVFKFYLQVWLIFGIASAVMIGWMAQLMRRWSGDLRLAWILGLIAFVGAGLLYPAFATPAKINDRFDARLGPTWDSMQFMTVAHANEQGQDYAFRDEYDALIWMQDHIQGTPVVAESAAAPEYRSLRNRVTTYTGLPALIGYTYHQKQQRSILPSAVLDRRIADANQIFTALDTTTAWQLIQRYDVGYVIVGYPERLYYPAAGLAKFDQMVIEGRLRVAYKNPHVTLYEVTKAK
jgi:uncharacterized membrane protein